MHSKFWQVIKDDSKRTFEVCGQATNTNHFTNKTVAMQRAGMNVSNALLPVGTKLSSKSFVKVTGYTPEDGLYDRLLKQFQKIKEGEMDAMNFDSDVD